LDEHWGSTDFLNKSFTAKANRSVDRGASAYCGGSISTAAHFEKLVILLYIILYYIILYIYIYTPHLKFMWLKEFQRPPTASEVMEKTKKLKSGEWVNDKSREFVVSCFF